MKTYTLLLKSIPNTTIAEERLIHIARAQSKLTNHKRVSKGQMHMTTQKVESKDTMVNVAARLDCVFYNEIINRRVDRKDVIEAKVCDSVCGV